MKKRKLKGWIIGGIIGFLLGIIKYLCGGFTWFDYSAYQALFNLVYLTITFSILISLFFKLDSTKVRRFLSLTCVAILLIYTKAIMLMLNTKFLGILVLSAIMLGLLIFYLSLIDIILFVVMFLLSKLFRTKVQILKFLSVINIWFFLVMVTIEDMLQHFNLGGASGRWYKYGDIILIVGFIVILAYFLVNGSKNEK